MLLGQWAGAGIAFQRAVTAIDGVQFATALALAAGLVLRAIADGAEPASLLLLVYWALNLPALGQEAASVAWQYPGQRNTMLRLMEPLSNVAPAVLPPVPSATLPAARPPALHGIAVRMEGVSVRAAGHLILQDIDLDLAPGSHTAIVGPSGAGKSSLAGLLLGWHCAAAGRVLVDGVPLEATHLDQLRAQTAWVDPQVQLWNSSVLENLLYGAPADATHSLDETLLASGMHGVLRNLPDGLQTVLGEGGALVSGGEGQRVRAARAMARRDARLVILDEPARGLDRERRRALLGRARELWRSATLIYITHDVADTRDFERVLVIENARIAEDGVPAELALQPGSRYHALLDAEHAVRCGLWANRRWRRLRMEGGSLSEQEPRKEVSCGKI